MVTSPARDTWVAVGWVGAVLATAVNGILVGYGAVWFQLMGTTADAEDYRVSAGGYAAAAVVLVLAVPAILTHRAPRWLVWPAGASAVVLGLLAAGSAAASAQAEQVHQPTDTAWDGVGGVVWAPWTWALVVLGVRGLYRLASGRRIEPGAR